MMFTQGGILYTTLPRRQAPGPRPEHKMAEWKVDWWLGKRLLNAAGDRAQVTGSDVHEGKTVLVLTLTNAPASVGRMAHVPLTVANKALRKGTWELL